MPDQVLAQGKSSPVRGRWQRRWRCGRWTRESMGMRCVEAWLVRLAERWVEGVRERREVLKERFVRRALDDGHQGADKAGQGSSAG